MAEDEPQPQYRSVDEAAEANPEGYDTSHGRSKDEREGWEPLLGVQSVVIITQRERIENDISSQTGSRFILLNHKGKRIYSAAELSSMSKRTFLGSNRPYEIYFELDDPKKSVAFMIKRECNCMLGCLGSRNAGTKLVVTSGFTGELFGSVVQKCSCITPKFAILDPGGDEILTIDGPKCGSICPCFMCVDAIFSVYFSEKSDKAKIQTQLAEAHQVPSQGFGHHRIDLGVEDAKTGRFIAGQIIKRFKKDEMYESQSANMFGLTCLANLDPQMKALLIGAAFAIDFSYFESSSRITCSICYGASIFIIITLVSFFVAYMVWLNA